MKTDSGKPSYDDTLSAYQRAFHRELQQVVLGLFLEKVARVLDAPCGNCFYSRLLGKQLDPEASLDCTDLCDAYLSSTRKRLQNTRCNWNVQRGDVFELPFGDSSFELVWCAQSLISLDAPLDALHEMKRALRSRGTLAILENDIFHHVILTWPVEVEIPIERALQRASKSRFGSSNKLSPARKLSHLLAEPGFHSVRKRTFAADRLAPWPASLQRFLEFHVRDLWKLTRPYLSEPTRAAFRRFTSHRGARSLFCDDAADLTCLNVLYEARK